jgi:copper chaperone CopZ
LTVRTPTTACTVCELHAESVFKVEGLDCHEEVALIERRFKHLNGLEAFSADVVAGRLRVQYDAARLSTGAIVGAVATATAFASGDGRALAASGAVAGSSVAEIAFVRSTVLRAQNESLYSSPAFTPMPQ